MRPNAAFVIGALTWAVAHRQDVVPRAPSGMDVPQLTCDSVAPAAAVPFAADRLSLLVGSFRVTLVNTSDGPAPEAYPPDSVSLRIPDSTERAALEREWVFPRAMICNSWESTAIGLAKAYAWGQPKWMLACYLLAVGTASMGRQQFCPSHTSPHPGSGAPGTTTKRESCASSIPRGTSFRIQQDTSAPSERGEGNPPRCYRFPFEARDDLIESAD